MHNAHAIIRLYMISEITLKKQHAQIKYNLSLRLQHINVYNKLKYSNTKVFLSNLLLRLRTTANFKKKKLTAEQK